MHLPHEKLFLQLFFEDFELFLHFFYFLHFFDFLLYLSDSEELFDLQLFITNLHFFELLDTDLHFLGKHSGEVLFLLMQHFLLDLDL